MNTAMRLRLFLLVPILATLSFSGDEPRPVLGASADMTATPVALDPAQPPRRRVGALTYLGGVRLTSADPAFGGFSAMHVIGDRFLLVSDGGNIVRFAMGPDWKPRDISFGDIQGPGGGWWKGDRDAEAMTGDPATGRLWVSFERWNRIARYDSTLARLERSAEPPAMRRWFSNGGGEAMARLRGGAFVVIAERSRAKPGKSMGRAAIRFDGDPVEAPRRGFRFSYLPPAGYDPSDLAELPDGRLLVLNRRVTLTEFFTAKLTLVDPSDIRPGAEVKGREIATIGPPLTRDNFEALAVTREGSATIVWLATDDNREVFERSLLMKFRLDLPGSRP